MLPGVGEKDFDPAKAAAQNAGSSAEEYCRSVDLNTFCTKCLAPQWFDPKVSSGPRLKDTPVRSEYPGHLRVLYHIQQGTQSSTAKTSQMGYLLTEAMSYYQDLGYIGVYMAPVQVL